MNTDDSGYKFNWGNVFKVAATVAIVATLTVAALTIGGPLLVGAAIGAAVGTAVGAGIGYSKDGINGAINGALIGSGVGSAVGAAVGVAYGLIAGESLIGSTGRVFWSGVGQEAAGEYASSVGGTTLEQTFAGRILNKIGYNKITAPLWKLASAGYALGARGTTYIIRSATIRAESVWLTIEKPIIEYFDKVEELIEKIL